MSAFSRNFRMDLRQKRDTLDEGYPTREILFASNPPDLIENRIDASYHNVSEYLDIQSGLLLEDLMCPLREALTEYQKKTRKYKLDGVQIYQDVRLDALQKCRRGKRQQISGVLNLDNSKNCAKVEFGFGSLLVFTSDNFKTTFFLGMVIIENGKRDTDEPTIKVKLKIPKDAHLSFDQLGTDRFTVMKADAFFYVYFHVLKALNTLSETTFPMKRYIVYGNKEMKHPGYMSEETTYDIFGTRVPVLDFQRWPLAETLDMNPSQFTALQKALTEEVALVQGPPGTGKTFFGIKLVKVLLDNVSVWNRGLSPLLIVCQSNQALDYFMEGLLKFTKKLVRVGDQCQSEKLKPFSLKELVCREFVYKENLAGAGLKGLSNHLEKLDRIRFLKQQLSQGILRLKTMEKYEIIDKMTFENEDTFLEWLGFNIRVDESTLNDNLIISLETLTMVVKKFELAGDELAENAREELEKVQQLMADYKNCCRQEISPKGEGDLLSLQPTDAKAQYLHWVDALCVLLQDKQDNLEKSLQDYIDEMPYRKRLDVQLNILRTADVVGLTSTGAASRREILEKVQSPIVIFDEAAQVLESHVVVSMTDSCEHLILLGDHKQLKPNVTTHHMGTDYHLNMSLFERLMENKVANGACLNMQYRMRPEISSLLKPYFYEQLLDADVTKTRPAIKGLSKSLFFLDHKNLEEKRKDKPGFWNPYEVEMLISLAKYLVFVGYTTTDITIIAMYTEQKNKLIQARDKVHSLFNLQITSVDNFQGRENEIILLSLVRSNIDGNIGFLKEDNRVCVALSRARSGLFIAGNMTCLSEKGVIWRRVRKRLQEQDAFGSQLTLVCKNHGSSHQVSEIDHWNHDFCTAKERVKSDWLGSHNDLRQIRRNKSKIEYRWSLTEMTGREMCREDEDESKDNSNLSVSNSFMSKNRKWLAVGLIMVLLLNITVVLLLKIVSYK